MYYTAAGGVAGGVVVGGYFAKDSALGLRSFIRLWRTLGKLVAVFCKSLSFKGDLLIQYLIGDLCVEVVAVEDICIRGSGSVCVSITSAFFSCFLPLIPAKSCAKFPLIPWVTSWLTCRRAEGCEYINDLSRIHARACQLFSPAWLMDSSKDTSRSRLALFRALLNALFLACQFWIVAVGIPRASPARS